MSYIFSFIHCSSTQIMCQVCFENIYRTVMSNCSKYTIILFQASKKRMLIPTPVLQTGTGKVLYEFWVSVAHRDSWVWLSSEK